MLKPKAGPIQKHWAKVSDEQLAGLDLEIEGPDKLPGIVTEIPPGDQETYIEFTYDLRGMGRVGWSRSVEIRQTE